VDLEEGRKEKGVRNTMRQFADGLGQKKNLLASTYDLILDFRLAPAAGERGCSRSFKDAVSCNISCNVLQQKRKRKKTSQHK
jgi:hypothetical protein